MIPDIFYTSGLNCKVVIVDKQKMNGSVELVYHTSEQVFDAVKLGIQGGAKRVIIEVMSEDEESNDEQ